MVLAKYGLDRSTRPLDTLPLLMRNVQNARILTSLLSALYKNLDFTDPNIASKLELFISTPAFQKGDILINLGFISGRTLFETRLVLGSYYAGTRSVLGWY